MIVEIKQNPDRSAISVGLQKYNRSKLPGTYDLVYPGKGIDGRYLTGIDPNAASINSIPNKELRDKRREEVAKLKEELEGLIDTEGLSLDATSKFWHTFAIKLGDDFMLNLTNPKDKLTYHVLVANGYVAPELGLADNPEYMSAKFYVSRIEEEAKTRMVTRKTKDQARAELLKLSENYDKMVLIAKFLLGVKRIKPGMGEDIIYEELSNFIENPKEKNNIILFLDAVSKSIEDLQYKLTIDEAVRKSIIKVREGYFQRGNATYGKTLKEVIDYLSSLENSAEFASLKEEVDNS